MILAFTPNPCLEKTYALRDLKIGASLRVAPQNLRLSVGGKGFNAARVARNFGAPVLNLAPVGKNQAGEIRALLEAENLPAQLIETQNPTRWCLNLTENGVSTEILENGIAPSLAEGAQILEAWRENLKTAKLALIGGNYAPSDEKSWALHGALLCQMARAAGIKTIYDARDGAFQTALNSKNPPWAIKPNLREAREILGKPILTPSEERGAIRHFLTKGVEVVLLSCGARGLYVGFDRQIEFFKAPHVETVSAVGSGDSLVGAFAAKFLETGDVWESARWGVAAGSVNAQKLETALVFPDEARAILPFVTRKEAEISLGLLQTGTKNDAFFA